MGFEIGTDVVIISLNIALSLSSSKAENRFRTPLASVVLVCISPRPSAAHFQLFSPSPFLLSRISLRFPLKTDLLLSFLGLFFSGIVFGSLPLVYGGNAWAFVFHDLTQVFRGQTEDLNFSGNR